MQAQLPTHLLDEELGLEVLQWIGKHVEATTDNAAEVVTALVAHSVTNCGAREKGIC